MKFFVGLRSTPQRILVLCFGFSVGVENGRAMCFDTIGFFCTTPREHAEQEQHVVMDSYLCFLSRGSEREKL